MFGDWTIVRRLPKNILDKFAGVLSATDHVYLVENNKTGEQRHVAAYDLEEVGDKIAVGDFLD